MGLKEATSEKHRKAERMPFNVLMINGKLTAPQYEWYLQSQYKIFEAIEDNFELPHPALARKEAVKVDIDSVGMVAVAGKAPQSVFFPVSTKAIEYAEYLKSLTQEEAEAHMYLHYLALMFGGQMIKKKVPGNGAMYEFGDDMMAAAGAIRSIQQDEWADEVNKGFDYMIDIFKELYIRMQ
jgi:heme oxygenase